MKRPDLTRVSMIVGGVLLLAGLYLLSQATQNSAAFDRYYIWLLLFNAAAAAVLLGFIIAHLVKLVRGTGGERPARG